MGSRGCCQPVEIVEVPSQWNLTEFVEINRAHYRRQVGRMHYPHGLTRHA
jgi:hypothetical protein